jgi:hypothetical protein
LDIRAFASLEGLEAVARTGRVPQDALDRKIISFQRFSFDKISLDGGIKPARCSAGMRENNHWRRGGHQRTAAFVLDECSGDPSPDFAARDTIACVVAGG